MGSQRTPRDLKGDAVLGNPQLLRDRTNPPGEEVLRVSRTAWPLRELGVAVFADDAKRLAALGVEVPEDWPSEPSEPSVKHDVPDLRFRAFR
jgi:hypothetical protein